MDEILVANFMVFDDVVRDEPYDLWIGDEAWELDYFLHENPELKRAAYAWLTDFVGWLPMARRRGALTADYNAEMIEHIERFPRVRDRAIFVGDPADVVDERFGPGPARDPRSGPRRTSTSPATSPASTPVADRETAPRGARLRPARAGLPRHRRRLGRRSRAAAARDRRLPRRAGAGPACA